MLSPRVGDRFERTWDRNKHNCFGMGVNSCYKTVLLYQWLITVEIFWKRRGFGLKNGSDEEEEKKKC